MTGINPHVAGEDALTGTLLHIEPKAFPRGIVRDTTPQVGLVVKSSGGDIMAVVSLNGQDAHVLSERLRQEAELVSVIEEEKNK